MSAGAMAGAYESTAVWTGSEMIVWGGYNGSYLDSGGRYRPSSDAWTPTSTGANVPVGRSRHAAVWTGMEAIVWGGWAGAELGSGGRYCPSADSWTATSSGANVPASRYYHSATWLSGGTEMIVWGGTPFADHDGGRYCARPTGVTYYRDADGDGFGDANAFVTLCGGPSPSGYVSDNTDCNDGNAAIHPGAPEINDGIDNQCPGDPGYGMIDELGDSGSVAPDKATFSWAIQPNATSYQLARSTTPDFTIACTSFTASMPSFQDPATPTPTTAFYYIARATAPHAGSWGKTSAGIERTTSCP
jgi:hypothetical protein